MKRKKHHKKRNPARRRHSYVTNPAPRRRHRAHHRARTNPARRHHRYRRRNPESPMELFLTLGVSVVSAVGANKIASKLPFSAMVQNLGLVAIGGALSYIGRKKPLLLGIGSGMVIAGATRAVTNTIPALAGDYELTGDEQRGYINYATTQLAGAVAGGTGDFSGDDHDGFNGAVSGEFNTPSM
jgi:hypothetical protein